MNRVQSGRQAKAEGHSFEHVVCDILSKRFNKEFVVEGKSNTKIDVRDINSRLKFSVKNPKGKNTQVALMTQKSFIDAMNIADQDTIDFIGMFFGGDDYSSYSRHRMTRDQIDPSLNQKFIDFMNENTSKIIDILVTHGHNQIGDVNYMIWATQKNRVDTVLCIDLEKFKQIIQEGEWTQNKTTLAFFVKGCKIFHLQMKGSGEKYTSGYHSLMFHIHRNFDSNCVVDLDELINKF